MAGRSIHFYATKTDILSVLSEVESKVALQYMKYGSFLEPQKDIFKSLQDIPSLGFATHKSSVACDKYVFTNSNQKIEIREIDANDGRKRYLVDQLVNPNSACISFGGIYEGGFLLPGEVSSTGLTPEAIDLVEVFRKPIKKHFKRIKAFWIGTEARELKDSGTRLTLATQCPTTIDLK